MYVTKLNRLSMDEIDGLIEKSESLTGKGMCCPRKCGINRQTHCTPCGASGKGMRIASISRHMGEEPPVSGENGACNVFFSGCTMKCVFCQNFPFSQLNNGREYSIDEFCSRLLKFQSRGVHNINLVTSDQYLAAVLKSLKQLKGLLEIPVSYNCSGYHTPELLSIVDKFADIYLYDLKYFSDSPALKYSGAQNYPEISQRGAEFILKGNNAWIEEDGILKSGVIFRHLVLPGNIDDSISILNYASKMKTEFNNFRLSIMSQYFPAYKAAESASFPELKNKLREDEYEMVMIEADRYGIDGWYQELDAQGGC
ncbi:MAG: radical SAM protein [Spirochaetes bacterium]|nr:radical SAM protein [Spirochaetota bacterium]